MPRTLDAAEACAHAFEQTTSQIEAPRGQRDPDRAIPTLEAMERQIEQLEQYLAADRDLFAEASRSYDAAKNQLQMANKMVPQAETDQVPDSPGVTQIAAQIRNLCENRLNIPYDDTETLGECLQRIIDSGLFEWGNTPVSTQFQNLSANQRNKITQLFNKFGLTIPAATDTVKQINQRGGPVVWPGNDRAKVGVDEF